MDRIIMHTHWIIGKNCVQIALDHASDRIIKLYTSKKGDDPLLNQAEKNGIKIQTMGKHQLDALVKTDSHQSYVAEMRPKKEAELKALLEKEPPLVLMLDAINDPHNLGALLRAAECFGAGAVIWSKNRGCSLTPGATKAAVGASELVPCVIVSNLAETVRRFQEVGYTAVTAEIGKDARSLWEYTFPEKTLLILGSEGEGVQPLISKLADEKVYIPMAGVIDSLNVSQAASVLLAHYRSQLRD